MSRSRDQINEYLRRIDITGKTVLDAGSGGRDKWAINYTKGKPSVYHTLDVEKAFDPTFVFDLNYDVPLDGSPYDVVFCLETLEHIWNPLVAVRNLSRFTSGTCYISVPFINPIHDTHDFLRYTSQWFMKVLFKHFTYVEITHRRATLGEDLLKEFYKIEGMRMSKITQQLGYGDCLLDVGYIIECRK